MVFNKTEHIEKMQPAVKKMLNYLSKDGIEFSPIDTDGLNNITLTRKDEQIKISQHSFYRFSGISCVYDEKGEGDKKTFKIVEVTDEMFMMTFMKQIVEALFKIKK